MASLLRSLRKHPFLRFSLLFAAGNISRGGTSATQRKKFHTDDAENMQNCSNVNLEPHDYRIYYVNIDCVISS